MGFEWDETKSQQNLAKHSVDFRRATQIFRGRFVEEADARRDYGETRITWYGVIAGRIYVVIYTWRGTNRRIISARKANGREIRAYHARHP
jgi:uncharacterized DUF497 family protein